MGDNLYWMITITDRNQSQKFLSFYKTYGIEIVLSTLGKGTAASEILNDFGLEATQKAVLLSVVTGKVWSAVQKGLQTIMLIDIPGTGIAFTMPLSSIGGKRQLEFLTNGQPFQKGEESVLKDTKYELLVVIANQGYTEQIMAAARRENAGGGTVIHAKKVPKARKGSFQHGAEKFLGVSLASEKELVLIVVKHADKNNVMTAIMQEAGLETKAKAIVFSLPVTGTAGLRLQDLNEENT